MTVYYADERVTLHHGDCLEVMRTLPDSSVDAIVTDPPYGLGFMGREWDALPPGLPWAQECLRVLKPGGHLLAFGGTRTWHRLAVAVEDAGFEIRDSIAWLYGSGFPKSLDVSKAIDKAAGATREVIGQGPNASRRPRGIAQGSTFADDGYVWQPGDPVTAPATPDAEQWQGWGTALKPAFEPIVVGRKPLVGTVAGNVLTHGTGALNIDACRVHAPDAAEGRTRHGGGIPGNGSSYELPDVRPASPAGRWPANVVLDDTQAAKGDEGARVSPNGHGDSGGASRFFPTFRYQAKAPTRERVKTDDGVAHPTVKPLELMRWLVRLVTPPGGVVLEPFAGSGTTVEACMLEGFRCIAIEREADYLPLIDARIARAQPKPVQGPDSDEVLF